MKNLTIEQIKEISETIDCGLICHWNIKTNKLIFLPNEDLMAENDTDAWDEDIKEIEENYDDFRLIEKPDSTEAFKFMEEFVDSLPENTPIKNRLFYALEGSRPFRAFNADIHNDGEYKQQWFDFKNQKMIDWVEDRINEIIAENEE